MFVLLCVFLRNILFLLIDPSLARIAYGMIKDAEDKGLITPGKVDQIISYIRVFFVFAIKNQTDTWILVVLLRAH
jgi:hypothetical protein